jgi:hypothetical protein
LKNLAFKVTPGDEVNILIQLTLKKVIIPERNNEKSLDYGIASYNTFYFRLFNANPIIAKPMIITIIPTNTKSGFGSLTGIIPFSGVDPM